MISNTNAAIFALALSSVSSAGASYQPTIVSCPSNSSGLIRTEGGLSSKESSWVSKRDAITEPILKSFLSSHLNSDTDVSKIFSSDNSQQPKVAFAVSGGSYRAMLAGAGMLSAFDNRTDNNTGSGKLGGLLQGATYLAGLSGGNWLTTSLAFNDWISVQEIVDQVKNNNGFSLWNITNSILAPFGAEDPMADLLRWATIRTDIQNKEDAGFPVSIVDLWGLAVSYHLFENGAQDINWSSLQQSDVFANAEMPFIISTADEYNGLETINTTIFEFNPFEFGSWDHNKFTDIEFLGTVFNNGSPVNSSQCVNGFDNVGLISGTSAGLFNEVAANIDHLGLTGSTKQVLEILISSWASENGIPAAYPNPFFGLEEKNDLASNITTNEALLLVDGGEDGETLPFVPLLQKEREIDAIFAFDIDADTTEFWPSGLDMYATFARQAQPIGSQIAFPFVPNATVFVEEALNKKTVFFGCNSTLLSELSHIPPVIVYIPNNEYSFASNTSTFKLAYSDEEKIGMIENGYTAAYNNNTDSNYATCVSCAVVLRSQQRLDITPSEECQKCFEKYCWEPTA